MPQITPLEVMRGWLEQKTLAQPEIIAIWNMMQPRPHGYVATLESSECAMAVTAAAIKAGCPETVFPECGANNMIKGMIRTDKPYSGCIIGYDWNKNGTYDHVGYVDSVNGDRISAIEANVTVGGVGHRMYRRTFSLVEYRKKYGPNAVVFCEPFPRNEPAPIQDDPTPAQPPEDKGPSGWAREAADWAQIAGLFQGDKDGSMRWQDPITREELAVVLQRFYNFMKK